MTINSGELDPSEKDPTVNLPAEHVGSKATFLARSSKALAGGITGAVTAGGTALTTALADGAIDGGDGWLIAGAIVGGFAIGFAGVWSAPANK